MPTRWTIAAIFLLFAAPAASGAPQHILPNLLGPLPVFEESVGSGGVFELELGTHELNLYYDPTVNTTGGIYGFGELMLVAFGGVTPTEFACLAENCLYNTLPTSTKFPDIGPGFIMTGGNIITGEFSATELGTLMVDVTAPGLLALVGGHFFDAEFTPRDANPIYIAAFGIDPLPDWIPWNAYDPAVFFPRGYGGVPNQFPEPSGAWLLSLGIAGVIFLRRAHGKS